MAGVAVTYWRECRTCQVMWDATSGLQCWLCGRRGNHNESGPSLRTAAYWSPRRDIPPNTSMIASG